MMQAAQRIDKAASSAPARTDQAQVLQLIYGRFAGQAACVAAKLGIPDRIAAGRETTQSLAAALALKPDPLRRLLRVLAGLGLFIETAADRWTTTPAGELLRHDAPGALGALAGFFATSEHATSWLALEHALRTGDCAFAHVHGEDAWHYGKENPAWRDTFNRAMSSIAASVQQAIADHYDFSDIDLLVDIGGGHGRLMACILARFPELEGIVFDMPHVVSGASDFMAERGLAGRCRAIGGDFFASVPAGADAYIMTAILHDWDDDACVAILGNCRKAMKPDGRVLVGEFVLKETNEPDLGKLVDLEMLVMTRGGRERTADEFRQLFARADLVLTKIIPLPSGNSLIEAAPR